MKRFGTRLRDEIEKRFMTISEFADELGVDRSTVQYYLTLDQPPKAFGKILKVLGITKAEFYGEDHISCRIPIYGSIAAGIPIEAIEDIQDFEDVDPTIYTAPREFFALRLKGVSMMPRMHSGDVVIFHKQPDADSGDIVAVFVGGEDATCKQLIKTDDGIVLHALNESFGDMSFTQAQVASLPITILGKAVELRSRL